MTNNPEKLVQLEACGIKISERVAHVFPSNQHNEKYLQTKADRSGHLI
jgi:GTP cyclohydrolase II